MTFKPARLRPFAPPRSAMSRSMMLTYCVFANSSVCVRATAKSSGISSSIAFDLIGGRVVDANAVALRQQSVLIPSASIAAVAARAQSHMLSSLLAILLWFGVRPGSPTALSPAARPRR
jgi:hypothetical protein